MDKVEEYLIPDLLKIVLEYAEGEPPLGMNHMFIVKRTFFKVTGYHSPVSYYDMEEWFNSVHIIAKCICGRNHAHLLSEV